MGYRKNVKKLKKSLRDNKVLTRFKLNCINNDRDKPTNLGFALEYKLKHYSLLGGFIWSETPECLKFWVDLQRKFEESK